MDCFAAVFPALTQEEILRADHYNVSRWDSVASATLFATIEEEFGVELEIDDLSRLVSFETILTYLTSKTTA
jgi:acyl carrier protein